MENDASSERLRNTYEGAPSQASGDATAKRGKTRARRKVAVYMFRRRGAVSRKLEGVQEGGRGGKAAWLRVSRYLYFLGCVREFGLGQIFPGNRGRARVGWPRTLVGPSRRRRRHAQRRGMVGRGSTGKEEKEGRRDCCARASKDPFGSFDGRRRSSTLTCLGFAIQFKPNPSLVRAVEPVPQCINVLVEFL